MKGKDWLTILVIVGISAIFSFGISNVLFGGKKSEKLKTAVVEPISDEFTLPNEKYFNREALNPTQSIQIGTDQNQNPFKSGQ